MSVLVLNRFRFSDAPYHELVPRDAGAVLVTAARSVPVNDADRQAALAPFHEVHVIDDYDDAPMVEVLAHRLHRRHRFARVVAMSEFDLLRAARLREAWGIAGQGVESATAFRDKLDMKRRLRAAGVPVTDFGPVDNATDLVAFSERVGWPVVVKPRRGAASVGVEVLHGGDDLERLVQGPVLRGDAPAGLLAEEYVSHVMYGVDGVVDGGEVAAACPSAYDASCLDFHQGSGLQSVALDRGDPLAEELVALTRRALAALPHPPVMLFHAEVFRHRDRGLIFNEVGSRIGGAGIQHQLRSAYGTDPVAWFVRRELDAPGVGRFPSDWRTVAGWALIPPRPGRLVALPGECPVPGVVACDVKVRAGDELAAAASSVDALALLIAVGHDAADVRRILAEASRWFEDGTIVEPSVGPTARQR